MVEKTGVIKAVRPMSTPTYRLNAKLGRGGEPNEDLLSAAVNLVYDWFDSKIDETLPVGEARLQNFRSKSNDPDLEVVFVREKGIWSARLSHLDTGLIQGKPILGRRWVTDIGLAIKENEVFMGVQITALSQPGLDAPIEFIRPGIVRSLSDRIGLSHEIELKESCWKIADEAGLTELKKLVFAAERQLPVIILTQPDWKKWELTKKAPDYLLDPDELAKKLIGYAHVIALPFSKAFKWTEELGRAWSVFDGAVRIYWRGIDLDKDAVSAHQLFLKDAIHYYRYGDKFGNLAFSQYIQDDIRQKNPSLFQTWKNVQFITDARLLRAIVDREKVVSKQECAGCKEVYEAEINAYQMKLEEAISESQQYCDDSIKSDSLRRLFESDNDSLRRQLDALRSHLEAKSGESVDYGLEIPDNYAELPEWITKNMAGRLVLHPRAVRGVRDAVYEDVAFVYDCLILLASDYRSMRLGIVEKSVFEQKCDDMKVRLSGSIAKERAGEQGDTYFVKYPIGSQKNEFLEFHLRKGTTKDDKYTLGIYFFWHDNTRQVVVGWLPSHLENRMS